MSSPTLYVARPAARCRDWRVQTLLMGVLLLGAFAGQVTAAEVAAVVSQVQWPAWVEQRGVRSPLAAGQVLRSSDRLVTGEQARVTLRLADGSAVKLGERAELTLATLQTREADVLDAGLEIAKGAFRFTTGLFRQVLGQRQVAVRFPTLTIGVRGTDFWGKSGPDKAMVLLLEGQVALTHHAEGSEVVQETRQMTTPMEYLVAEGRAPLQQKTASPQEVARWAAETDPNPQRPSGKTHGTYRALIVGGVILARAEKMAGVLREMGYPAEVSLFAFEKDPAALKRFAVTLPGISRADDRDAIRLSLRTALQDRAILRRS